MALASASLTSANTFDDPLRFFADCTGRLSAEMEHSWLLSDGRTDAAEHDYEVALGILEAMTTPTDATWVLSHRISAKAAQTALLHRATFQGDARSAQLAAQYVASCTSLILS